MSNKIFSFILAAFLFFCVSHVAHACSCYPSASPCFAFERSQAVFVGLVTSVTQDNIVQMLGEKKLSYGQKVVQFTVEESLKGVATKTVDVVTGMGGGDCGYKFETGERYLVYAHKHESPTNIRGTPLVLIAGGSSLSILLGTRLCSRTQPLKYAADDLELIRALNTGKPETRIFGRVFDLTRQPNDPPLYYVHPMAGITVKAENDIDQYQTQTDSDGRYQFRNIKPGKYKVTVVLPDGYTLPGSGGHFKADITSTCGAEAIFRAHSGPMPF